MAPQWYQGILVEKKPLTHDVWELTIELRKPESLAFRAGQFMNIKIEDGNPKIMFRSYSIMSPPRSASRLTTCIKRVPEGRGSTWLTTIPEGTPLTFMAPLGIFTFKEQTKNAETPEIRKTIFIATGTGITPLRCMIEDELEKGNRTPLHLVWGFRYQSDIFYEKELADLAQKHPNFTYAITLSKPDESWNGASGRVTDWLEKNLTDAAHTQTYICGVGNMVFDTASLCKKKGMPKENIHFERYD